jgi:hypothetical protein
MEKVQPEIAGDDKRAAEKAGKTIPFRKVYGWIAAAAIFAGIVFFYQWTAQPAEINGEDVLSEVQNYYIMQFEDEAATVEQLLQNVDENDRNAVLKDIESMREEAAQSIQSPEEETLSWIVNTYSFKIEALQHIRNILSDSQQI